MINGLQIVLDEPYPSIKNLQENKKLAYKIKKVYAGNYSELSCTMKYIYQSLILNDELKEIKEALKKIAIVEMHHLDILGKMLIKLGLNPAYTYINKSDNETYWQSDLIDYSTDIIEFLHTNIKIEEKAIKEYQKLIKYADDEIITDIFQRIILDEENHVRIFKSILNNLI